MTKLLADLFEIMANVRVTIPTKHDIRVVKTNISPDTLYRLKKLFESALVLTCFFLHYTCVIYIYIHTIFLHIHLDYVYIHIYIYINMVFTTNIYSPMF